MTESKSECGCLPADASDSSNLIAVGVGASAGGLEAFTELLRYLPPATGMAFVLVQHLDPVHESALPNLLSGRTEMPVVPVQNDQPLEPNHVYVIPPNAIMSVRNRTLKLEQRPAGPEAFRPVDIFFKSLAEEFRSKAVGIVLSGTATDGTMGLKTIKAEGGITFAQNQTAKFDGMPRSAISAGVVDFVLSPRRIAEELAAIARRTFQLDAGDDDPATADVATLHRLHLLLRRNTGVDFTQYKQPTILRRLRRRLVLRNAENLRQYLSLLEKEPDEVKTLFDDLLINVTSFFRDPEVFEAARRIAFPSLLRDPQSPHTIRAWIPGCSSGEEVYSLAILLLEFLESEGTDFALQLFGTDISESAIRRARVGIYDSNSLVNVSPERLRRFFVRTEAGYQVNRSVREVCIFSLHNVASDPPLSRMDLISCRNLLIYLSPALQRRVIATFGYALQPSGCLILGSSETLGDLSEYFRVVEEPYKIYSRRANIPQTSFHLSEAVPDYTPDNSGFPAELPRVGTADRDGRVHDYVDQIVLSQYGPAGVVVEEHLRIVEYRGDVAPYLMQTEMRLGAELMTAVREELRTPLTAAIEQSRRTDLAVVADRIPSVGAGAAALNTITVVPLSEAPAGRHFLILFGRSREQSRLEEVPSAAPAEPEGAAPLSLTEENARLRHDVKATRDYLQAVIEELRSTNEEAQAANEELQSTNEEMQTSKEELQSSNEELSTINAEMQSRNGELARLNDDLINLLGSINVPIVMTGNDLRIRRFTPTAERALRLIPTDVGRPITDLKPRISVPDLEEILQRVLDTLQPYEREVQDQEGRSYLMRVRPYRTADNRIDGAVLQLLDVSDLKRSMEEVKLARDYAEAIVNAVREPLVVLDKNLTIANANRAFYDALDLTDREALGQSIYRVARGRFDMPQVRALLQQVNGGPQVNDVELEYQADQPHKHNGPPPAAANRAATRVLSLHARRLPTPEQKQFILLAFEDVTERKRAAEARYRRLFESARDGIVLVDAVTGDILDLNPSMEQLLGYTRDELANSKLWEIDPMRNAPKVQTVIDRVRDQGHLRIDDLPLRTRDGHDLQTEVIASMYSEGDRRAIQLNIRDVSERKKFQRELQETQKLESLGLLAGGIAHDFNNLLTGILGNASLAYSEVPANQEARAHLREIVQAGERAAFLTRQMLAYAGRARFVIETIDLGDLIREISALVRASIPRAVELRLDLAPDLPPIEADPAQIQQVVMNLVINAAEAIGENAPGRVDIRTSLREFNAGEAAEFFGPEQSAAGAYIQVEVNDTGSGMDEATMSRIFDPFFTTKFTGRGLGLAAVQGILRGHSGAIRVYSTPGHGTCFVILLPARHRKIVAKNPERRRGSRIAPGKVALVIDDEESILTLVDNVLSREGMKVMAAVNGKTGVESFREHNAIVSMVLLDLQMPVMEGEEVFHKLNQINPDVPVILSSGFDESEAARRFAGLKPARFLQKPYTAERLVEAVAATLNPKV